MKFLHILLVEEFLTVYMKATGIVRRIDELGRVVIPKEIRRTLRLKDGDPVEIFTERDELMLKKYSPIAALEQFSESTAKTLHDLTGMLSIICDTDEVLYACGDGRKSYMGRHLSDRMDKILKDRRMYIAHRSDNAEIHPIVKAQEDEIAAEIVVPIIAGGDCLGAVVAISHDGNARLESGTIKLCQLTAAILAQQFE